MPLVIISVLNALMIYCVGWNKKIRCRQQTHQIKIKPCTFSNDDKYIEKLVSLAIDHAPKKNLAPVKPTPFII